MAYALHVDLEAVGVEAHGHVELISGGNDGARGRDATGEERDATGRRIEREVDAREGLAGRRVDHELRRALRSAPDLCPNNLARARQLFDSLNVVSQAENVRYDLETAHGTAHQAQAAWSALVHARLDSLDAYANP